MIPAFAKQRHPIVEQRTQDLTELANNSCWNEVEDNATKIGVITSGVAYQYAKEALGSDVSYLKLGMVNPLPTTLISDFCAKYEKVYVIEELDPVIEQHCKALGCKVVGKELFPITGELSAAIIAEKILGKKEDFRTYPEDVPGRPPVLCPGCPHRGAFYVFKKLGLMVNGDIGCYALGSGAPLQAVDTTVCMGFSVSGVHGFDMATEGKVRSVGILGDSTFCHSGVTGLMNIAYNQGNSTVVILDNSITGMTGHQQNPTTGKTLKGDPTTSVDLEALCKAVGINRVRVADPYDLDVFEQIVREETETDEPSVIIARRPCALLKTAKINPPLHVDTDACKGCKQCLKIGCPCISFADKKASINNTLCVGCGLCASLCKFGAIKGGTSK